MNTCKIKIGGKLRIFRYNFHSYNIICQGMGINPSDFPEMITGPRQVEFTIWVFIAGIYTELERNEDHEGIEELGDVTKLYHKISDWIMDLDDESKGKPMATFLIGNQLENDTNNGQKRKGTKKKK